MAAKTSASVRSQRRTNRCVARRWSNAAITLPKSKKMVVMRGSLRGGGRGDHVAGGRAAAAARAARQGEPPSVGRYRQAEDRAGWERLGREQIATAGIPRGE